MSEGQDIPEAKEAAEKWAKLIGLWDPVGFPNLTATIVANLGHIISTACREYATRLGIPLESSRPQGQWQELQQQLSSLQKENEELRHRIATDFMAGVVVEKDAALANADANIASLRKEIESLKASELSELAALREDVKPLLHALHTADYRLQSMQAKEFLSKHPELK